MLLSLKKVFFPLSAAASYANTTLIHKISVYASSHSLCRSLFRLSGHRWKHRLCVFIWMVDVIILRPPLSCNVSNSVRRTLWLVFKRITALLRKLQLSLDVKRLILSGKLCLKMAWYFIWPFGKSIVKVIHVITHHSTLFVVVDVLLFLFFSGW